MIYPQCTTAATKTSAKHSITLEKINLFSTSNKFETVVKHSTKNLFIEQVPRK